MWTWRVKMPTQSLLRLLLLLTYMLGNVLTTVWCRFGITKAELNPRVRCAFGNVYASTASTIYLSGGHCATIASFKVSTLSVLCTHLDSARPDECTLSLCTASPQRTCGTLSDQFFWCQVLAIFYSSQKTPQPLCSFSIYAIVRFATNSETGIAFKCALPLYSDLICNLVSLT